FSADYFQTSADYISTRISLRPKIAIVLGSCLGDVAGLIDNPQSIDYKDIPNFLVSTVNSHVGKLIFGKLSGHDVVCLSGRFHYYEGYDFEELVIPVRVLRLLGVETLILTNAAGGINEDFVPGDIMMICDHIKLYGASPLRGLNDDSFGPRFFDVTNMYTKSLRELAFEAAERIGIAIKEGVYFFFPGPQFESPAEIRASHILGADAVGMSTVTEALAAAHCGMKVLAFSLITNMAAGIAGPIKTEDVGETAEAASSNIRRLILEIIKCIGSADGF
ncbi:MAG: purine-nucleoside phosphorylase, partial [Oscillospiraceae bacterium]|nr:purine-nucleoside phosphorylase [Oscillospiraceae bacterium]